MDGIVSNKRLCFYPYELLNSLANDRWPSSIVLHIDVGYERRTVFRLQSDEHLSLTSRIIESSFIRYFEAYKDSIHSKFGSTQDWPPVWILPV